MVADHRRMKAAKLREEFASRLELVSPTAAAEMRADPPPPPVAMPSSYQRTPEEEAMVAAWRAKQGPQHCLPQWTPSEDSYGRVTFTADHPDQELALARTMAALGICSEPAFFLFLDLVVEHSRDDAGFNVQRLNQLIGVAAAFGPRDEAELFSVLDLMLLHEATGEIRLDPKMSFRDQLSWLIKMTSAAAQLTDKLKKQRSGGHHQIRVEHLYQQTLLGVEAKPPALAADPTPTLAIEASPGPAPSPMPARAGRRRRGS